MASGEVVEVETEVRLPLFAAVVVGIVGYLLVVVAVTSHCLNIFR